MNDHQWVPKEPTEAMLQAGYSELVVYDAPGWLRGLADVYRKMLAAAPAVPPAADIEETAKAAADHWFYQTNCSRQMVQQAIANALRAERERGEAELNARTFHLTAVSEVLGLTGLESAPIASFVFELKARADAAEAQVAKLQKTFTEFDGVDDVVRALWAAEAQVKTLREAAVAVDFWSESFLLDSPELDQLRAAALATKEPTDAKANT